MNGLEALDYLKRNRRRHYLDGDRSIESLDAIEKELKALEILKNTCIENWKIRISENYKEYIDEYINNCTEYITEEEYNLLKEVLKWD